MGFLLPSDLDLQKPCRHLPKDEITTPHTQQIIDRMLIVATGQRTASHARQKAKGRGLVGLAAPQIGEQLAIILIDSQISASRKRFGRLECLINPEIVWQSRETAEGREGCFSAGPVWGLVRRPVALKVRALDREGNVIERIYEDFTARIVCHEVDHLAGIRFPERIKSDRKRHWVHCEELLAYPKYMHTWPRLCTMARWEAYKAGRDISSSSL